MKKQLILALSILAVILPVTHAAPQAITINKDSRIVLLGNGLGSRMLHFGHFETGLHLRYPDHQLYIRNMCDEGNTPSFRPHSGRKHQLGFPGAEKFFGPYADDNTADGIGHLETEEDWLRRLKPDVIIAFFGFNESFLGNPGLRNFRAELDAFVKHTLQEKYNGESAAQLALVAPTAFQDITKTVDVPNGRRENRNLSMYTEVMKAVCQQNDVLFINAFSESRKWFKLSDAPLTTDGALLNDAGYRKFSEYLVEALVGNVSIRSAENRNAIHTAVMEKNWFWTNDFKIPNGVHVFGRRYKPYGPDNYPYEIKKIREMTDIRDQAIYAAIKGKQIDVAAMDAKTSELPAVKTNYNPKNSKAGTLEFLKGKQALAKIAVPEGYKIEQWATEQEFPDLANPVQMSFDNKGRLWVATMPSYPHYRPGDPMPDDKLLILEDTNNDGKADKQTVFADKLHLPMGFEIAPEGVYVSQGVNLVLLKDKDGDDYAEEKEVLYSGFDDHDTHHAISAYCADPSGAIFMCEGVFLRTNVETAYGPVRGTNGGFYRYNPQKRHLERHAQLNIPNPWGVAFDDWGQHFFLHTSGPTCEWMLPGSVKPRYGEANPKSKDLLSTSQRVRPTSGIEFVSSRHFPDDVQGDLLINNNIGFLGTKQHKFLEDGTGYTTEFRQDLTKSEDGNFRPVDLEFAPDGSLYIVDWHNPLIGHMQHNARDPNRDHDHGRVYRVTYPSRPLVKPAKVHGASIPELLDNLKLPEYRTRYRTRRELRGHNADDVVAAVKTWIAGLDKTDKNLDHHLVEALWVTWGANKINESLLKHLLYKSTDHRARAAAVRVARYTGHQLEDQAALLKDAARDPHGRVKLEAITAGSWIGKEDGLAVLAAAVEKSAKPAATEKPNDVDHRLAVVTRNGGMISIDGKGVTSKDTKSFTMTVPGNSKQINLSEMQITANGKNITKTAQLSQSSTMGSYKIGLLVDGDKSNFSHTNVEANPWIKVEFPTAVRIEEIKIWNRKGFESRFNNAKVKFFATSGGAIGETTVKISGGSAGGGNYAHFNDDIWIRDAYKTAESHLNGEAFVSTEKLVVPSHLKGSEKKLFEVGAEVYEREAHCGTCHQPDGNGLVLAGFPPLAGSKWVTGSEERLIKLTLNGLMGPIEVNGKQYPGVVPMTPFKGLLKDEEIAGALTYIRNSFGNKASAITADQVKKVRDATKDREAFYSPEELLKAHPMK